MAQGIGNLVVNLSANIAKFHSDMKEAAAVTQQSMGKIESAVSGASKAFSALVGAGIGYTIGREFRTAIGEIDKFRVGLISAAATMSDMVAKKGTGMNVGEIYAASLEHSKKMYDQLDLAAAKHFASGKELQMGYNMFLQKGVVLREKDIDALGIVVDKIKLLTQGQSSNLQIMQEIRSLNDGQARAGSALASLLKDELGKNWADIVEQHRQAGDLLQWMASLFPGLDAATKDIENTLEAQKETLTTMIAKVGREGLAGAYDDIVSLVKDINDWLKKHGEEVSGALTTGWNTIKSIVQEVVGLIQVIAHIANKGLVIPIKFVISGIEGLLPSAEFANKGLPDLRAGARKMLQARAYGGEDFIGYETPGEGLRTPWKAAKSLPESAFKPPMGGGGGGGGGGRGGGGGADKAAKELAKFIQDVQKEGFEVFYKEVPEVFKKTWDIQRWMQQFKRGGHERMVDRKWTAQDFERIEGGIERGPKKIWTPTGGKEGLTDLGKGVQDMAHKFGTGIIDAMMGKGDAFASMGIAIAEALAQKGVDFFANTVASIFDKIFGAAGEKLMDFLSQGIKSLIEGLGGFLSNVLGGIGGGEGGGGILGGIVSTIGGIFGFHSGGLVTAHAGYLASDERLIKVQTGERVLSRAQNQQWESRGGTGGGNVINIYPRYPMGRMETEYMVRTRLIPAMAKHQARYGGSLG